MIRSQEDEDETARVILDAMTGKVASGSQQP
jgi:uncharacterized membrane protein YkoI